MSNNSAFDTLKGLLGDDAEEKIQSVMGALGNGNLPAEQGTNVINDNSLEYIARMKGILDEMGNSNSDSRAQLLLSLKPFMRNRRQENIDHAIKLLNMTKLAAIFKK